MIMNWKVVKTYVDGHMWLENEKGEHPPDIESYFDEPGVVSVIITRQSIRRNTD